MLLSPTLANPVGAHCACKVAWVFLQAWYEPLIQAFPSLASAPDPLRAATVTAADGRRYLASPQVARQARWLFGCPTLPGALIENGAGSTYSDSSASASEPESVQHLEQSAFWVRSCL